MDVIPYEPVSFYIFDGDHNDFKRLYRINVLDSFFVIRSKGNLNWLRLIRYWDEEYGREFMFLTNAIGLKALLVAELYKNHWQT